MSRNYVTPDSNSEVMETGLCRDGGGNIGKNGHLFADMAGRGKIGPRHGEAAHPVTAAVALHPVTPPF